MTSQDVTTTILVKTSPAQAFAAINNPRAWWGKEIEGNTDRLDEEWTYRYKDVHYSKQKIVELRPNARVTWQVVDSYLSFIEDKDEWNGTRIVFDIAAKGDQTEIRFTHHGIAPDVECFDMCSAGWNGLINESLKSLIETGTGDLAYFD